MKQRKALARVDDEARKFKVDAARNIIYNNNYAVDTKAVKDALKSQSLVPTSVSAAPHISYQCGETDFWLQNAFSTRLGPLGFNLFQMLLVDLMHKFELGVWKTLFIHLLRILNAADKALVNELDRR